MAHPSTNTLGVDAFGLVMGLGFVLSFGYWCTDFLVIQRAMAADSEVSARRVPLIAAIPKMFFPILVILPGLIAVSIASHAAASTPGHPQGIIPVKIDPISNQPALNADGTPVYNYDLAIPVMLLHFFPTGILGLGLTALLASFMSGMAGNVTAFNTVWTYDIYQAYINKRATDAHYLWMGRMATIGGIALSIGAAYLATSFNNIMDALQLVFSFVNAPLFATFLLGMFWKRTTGHAAFTGLVSGTLAALLHHGLTLCHTRYPRRMDHRPPYLPQRHGAKLLDSNFRLQRQLRDHRRHLARHPTPPRARARRPRLLPHPQARRTPPRVVPKTHHPRRSSPRTPCHSQPRLRINKMRLITKCHHSQKRCHSGAARIPVFAFVVACSSRQ
jgi:hypothetical protein